MSKQRNFRASGDQTPMNPRKFGYDVSVRPNATVRTESEGRGKKTQWCWEGKPRRVPCILGATLRVCSNEKSRLILLVLK